MRKRTKEDVFSCIRKIHGDNINLNNAIYVNTHTRMEVSCNKCGFTWNAIPESLLNGCGCRKCSSKKRGKEQRHKYTKEEFIEKVTKNLRIQKDYDFSLLPDDTYELSSDKIVTVMCREHGPFDITIKNLFQGTGCPKCYNEKLHDTQKIPEIVFRERLLKLNPNLSYNPQDYQNTQTKIEFTCGVCGGKFWRKPNNIMSQTHLCPYCNKEKLNLEKRKTTEEYIQDAKKVWGDKYDLSQITYVKSSGYITPICPEHGMFKIEANSFLQGHGCPYHYTIHSKQELELLDFIRDVCKCDAINSNRSILGQRREIDILIKDKNIGFEYNGLYWHNELHSDPKSFLEKTNLCKENGITLYHIFEDEWVYKKDIVKSMVSNILGSTKNTLFARKCTIKEISSNECSDFLQQNHIQGRCLGKVRIGLFHDNKLVSVMLFGHARHFVGSGKQEWELLRMCSLLDYKIVGGASKMFTYFIRKYNPEEVITFADKRWSVGNVYYKLGFDLYNESKPSYFYVIGDKRYYRYNFRKSVLIKKYNCPKEMTEREFCFNQKWYRIYDCGCLCFKWTNNKKGETI